MRCVVGKLACGQTAKTAVRITLDEAIQMAIQHNHVLLAARTTIQQSEAEEITANLRPNPSFDRGLGISAVLHTKLLHWRLSADSTEADFGLSYLFERGKKRQHRLQAAKDITAVTRSLVADNERQLTFQVATLFFNVQLAESTLGLAQQDLKSFQQTVDIGERQFKTGAISENDYLKIKLQLLQYQTDLEQARVARESGAV